ncbi:MAG: recombination protein RecR [Ruminococcaceae bacterium]|nr:recombination protein RecR [Oscillospiraceae bacterium]
MGYKVAPLARLIEQFERMPGIGKKSAQRIAFYVLGMSDNEAKNFAQCVIDAHEKIHRCSVCGDLTDAELCPICANVTRDKGLICVVENPADVLAFERTREYKGTYHVLHGAISPINGIGPEELNIKSLITRAASGEVKEVIMATDPTVEGEATAMYLSKLIKPLGVTVSRLAYGVPVGGDLEYADEVTLQRAIEGRQIL